MICIIFASFRPQSRQASVDQDDEGGLFSAAPKSAKNITSKVKKRRYL